MAIVDPVIQATIDWVSNLLCEYAHKKGWKPEDYWVFEKSSENWNWVSFILVVRDSCLPRDSMNQTWNELWEALKPSPENLAPRHLAGIGLEIRSLSQVEEGGLYRIPDTFSQLSEPAPVNPSPSPAGNAH